MTVLKRTCIFAGGRLPGAESASVWKLVFITGIVASVAGLKLLAHDGDQRRPEARPRARNHRPVG